MPPMDFFAALPYRRRLMVDTLTPSRRSWLMSQVRQKDTKPEMVVRRLIHSMGFRYRLHGKELPGRPDLVFSKSKRVIFVHGCYWHRHDCKKASMPSSNVEYWKKKFAENVARDNKVLSELASLGWASMVVWECETRDADALALSLSAFLQD
jgi:DNA mismatch endonuclease, patch repair protein